MTDFVILGTDTDAGKTTFALLWLAAFGEQYEYWKPVETGSSDSELVKRLAPHAEVHFPAKRLAEPVAPSLAARHANDVIPSAFALARSKPTPRRPGRHLLIETFGSPFSPLNETELQLRLLHELRMPSVLISSTSLGTIGRTLQCLEA